MMENKKMDVKIKNFLIAFFMFIMFLLLMLYCWNNVIKTTCLKFESDKVNSPITMVHLSDLHEKVFGKDNNILLNKIKKAKPDVIFITGDIASFSDENMKTINSRSIQIYNQNLEYTIKTLSEIEKIAPTYLSLGNHEHVFEKFDQGFNRFKENVKATGVKLLINEIEEIDIKYNKINIFGADNSYYQDVVINKMIKDFEKMEGLKIILDHYPTDFDLNGNFSYTNYKIDYVFSGHEHGGQIRIPFIGGLISHEEGWFPQYSEGVHKKNGVTLIISRGLGNSTLPIRIFNNPELIVVKIL